VLKVSVISPEALLFEGEAAAVVAPAFDGEVGILESHAPMMTLLGKGELRLGSGGLGRSADRRFNIDGGFLQVVDNTVRVVTERASAV
jgi:F-type H+-transporting ATPase subunit epsilon